jgi:hypothetical protein
LYRFFTSFEESDTVSSSVEQKGLNSRPSGSLSSAPDGVSTRWRLVGVVVDNSGRQSWMVSDGSVIRVVYDPPAAKFNGWSMSIKMPEGEMVTTWSGRHGASFESLSSSRQGGRERGGGLLP